MQVKTGNQNVIFADLERARTFDNPIFSLDSAELSYTNPGLTYHFCFVPHPLSAISERTYRIPFFLVGLTYPELAGIRIPPNSAASSMITVAELARGSKWI